MQPDAILGSRLLDRLVSMPQGIGPCVSLHFVSACLTEFQDEQRQRVRDFEWISVVIRHRTRVCHTNRTRECSQQTSKESAITPHPPPLGLDRSALLCPHAAQTTVLLRFESPPGFCGSGRISILRWWRPRYASPRTQPTAVPAPGYNM